MKHLMALAACALLAACGADGEPVKPTVSGSTTVGVNSNSGAYNKNSLVIGIEL